MFAWKTINWTTFYYYVFRTTSKKHAPVSKFPKAKAQVSHGRMLPDLDWKSSLITIRGSLGPLELGLPRLGWSPGNRPTKQLSSEEVPIRFAEKLTFRENCNIFTQEALWGTWTNWSGSIFVIISMNQTSSQQSNNDRFANLIPTFIWPSN